MKLVKTDRRKLQRDLTFDRFPMIKSSMKTAATPSTLRFLNRRSIVQYLMHVPSASRAELAKAVGTSPVTAGKIVDRLIDERIIESVEAPQSASRVGRPGQLLRLDEVRPRFLLVQLGVTHTRASLKPLGFREDDRWDIEFDTPNTASAWAAQLQAVAGKQLSGKLWGILISAPGIVDQDAGTVLFSPNLHWTERQDFRALLRPLSAAPVLLVQEIQALALGELAWRRGRDHDFLLVDFSHGLGGAAVIGGQLYKTSLPFNSEIGHNQVIGNDRPCGCGAVGCVETLVSRRGLFQSLPKGSGPYRWERVIQHVKQHGLEPWLQHGLDAAGMTIGSALNVLGLHHVTITGSLHELPAEIHEYLAIRVKAATLWGRFGTVECHFAPRRRIRGLIMAGLERIILRSEPAET